MFLHKIEKNRVILYMYKKTRTRLKQILRKKTKHTTKKMIKGGKLKTIIDEIIGQGTHGTIYTHKYNKGQVIKVFKNEHRGEKCNEIKENEFDIQKKKQKPQQSYPRNKNIKKRQSLFFLYDRELRLFIFFKND